MRKISAWEAAVIVWIIWAGAQFALTEGVYRLAMAMDEHGVGFDTTALHDFSDFAAWPAGVFYDKKHREVIAEELRSLGDAPLILTSSQTTTSMGDDDRVIIPAQLADEVIAEDSGRFEKMYLAYDILDSQSLYPEVSKSMEYSIYGGVCIAWGFLVGLVTYFLIVLSRGGSSQDAHDLERYS